MMSFKKDTATCDHCKKVSHVCKMLDTPNRGVELKSIGWSSHKYMGKTLHLCPDCNDE